jgi:redox-sensitive bicupin YhaK (pirin superfamily)
MTLGSGALHSERNHSKDEPMRFIQMWIMPREKGLTPSVDQRVFSREDRTNVLLSVVDPDGEGGLMVHQDAWVYVSRLEAGKSLKHEFPRGFGAYLFLIEGKAALNGEPLTTGEAARIQDERRLAIQARQPSEFVLVEVRV